jgi:hypothetical protein
MVENIYDMFVSKNSKIKYVNDVIPNIYNLTPITPAYITYRFDVLLHVFGKITPSIKI